ncbi:basic region leucine zipper [Ancylostoma duodenale]|uniref:Basic region leucine zipper n=1 Tax=Ancylostoma duodenale TaxID=51022 RepID=A0A0C2G150_9BILA|nr:basic region leucine zipper [Ancylostoma duodenale]
MTLHEQKVLCPPEETQMDHRASHEQANILNEEDSLARAASLQECDRVRDPEGILNFLETTMNIDDYLEDITNMTGIPPEEIDLDDYELQKCNILYNDDKIRTFESYDPFAHDVALHEQLVPADYVAKTPTPVPVEPLAAVKVEPTWETSSSRRFLGSAPSTSSAPSARRGGRNSQPTLETYTPTTTARKYRLKTPQERNNSSYKVKRQRNNDAVRKSRTKAKQLQMMKDKQLEELVIEVGQLKEKLRVANDRLARCRCRR